MKVFLKTISTLLAVLFLLGSFSFLSVISVGAADTKTDDGEEEEVTASSIDYTTEVFKNPEEALKWMELMDENENYEMYFNTYTAVFAIRNKHTGQITFSNPYDVASSVGSTATKQSILSQIHIKYTDNDQTKDMYSYKDAALNGQIKVKKIKGAVRVEYVIGNESTRKLVPRLIRAENIVDLIFKPLAEVYGCLDIVDMDKGRDTDTWDPKWLVEYTGSNSEYKDLKNSIPHSFSRFLSYYNRQCLAAEESQKSKKSMIAKYPILEKNPEWILFSLEANTTSVELAFLEEMIKGYCPDYTFDQMDADHDETGYEAENELSPVFKLALEYSLNMDGFTVREPNNGLRYNTTLYQIETLDILPYFGAGNSYNTGYTMYPDGSGALFQFQDLKGKGTFTTSRKIYGTDYAYHTLDGTYQKALRMPVFGIESDDAFYVYTTSKTVVDPDDGSESIVETDHKVSVTVERDLDALKEALDQQVKDGEIDEYSEITKVVNSNGFFAVIEEGESLCQLATYHAGALSDYHTIMMNFNPRPKDSYDISDSISVTGSQDVTIVSDRKYSGNFKIRYIMLSDETLAKESGFDQSGSYHKASYVGMAQAYSQYLTEQGMLERLGSDDVKEDIPLYIESFGAMDVVEQILSFPVTVSKPLTTFEDVKTMYDELSEAGIRNINFRLTGFANGGMYATVPSKLKFERSVGGKSGMKDLLAYAKEVSADGVHNLGLYPDFDLLYVSSTSLFDGLSFKRDAIRTIDNRYTSRRYYSATQQMYRSYYQMALSPAYIDRFYNKLLKNYDAFLKEGSLGISVSSMGTDLNSDFDKDEPYNREDDKRFLGEALAAISSKEGIAGVMTDGGNAYTLKYVDHLLNVSLESSNFMRASRSIPFVGLVLHGYVQFTGTPLNMEGDADYALLKAIENGASLYFIMSYRNTSVLKESYQYSKYYSINYNIWKDDVISYYTKLNNVMKDLQTKLILNHEFISATRILDTDEIEAAIRAEMEANRIYEEQYEEKTLMEHIKEIGDARAAAKNAVATMEETLKAVTESADKMNTVLVSVERQSKKAVDAYDKYVAALNNPKATTPQIKAYLKSFNTARNDVKKQAVNGIQAALDAQHAYETALEMFQTASNAATLLTEAGAAEELIEDARNCANEAQGYLNNILTQANLCSSYVEDIYTTAIETKLTEEYQITREEIDKELNFYAEDDDKPTEDEEGSSSLVSNDGNVVAVTYGGKNGNDADPYKTFILNYNNYAVTVSYEVNGVLKVYTIPSNEFVMIVH